jgi:hypothetical protein
MPYGTIFTIKLSTSLVFMISYIVMQTLMMGFTSISAVSATTAYQHFCSGRNTVAAVVVVAVAV